MDINTAKHELQLTHIYDLLEENGVLVNYHKKQNAEEVDMLAIRMPDIEEAYIFLSFIPLSNEKYQAIDLLQIHYTLPEKIRLEYSSEIYLFLSRVNNYLPFGNLCIIDDDICNRHIIPNPRFENMDISVLLDILNLYLETLGVVETMISQVNSGQIDHQEALTLFR